MKLLHVLCVVVVALAARASAQDSCADPGACTQGLEDGATCQCNNSCADFGDCCSDYDANCLTCSVAGRCGETYDQANSCHCNDDCESHGNCCADYCDECTCNGGGGGSVTDAQLSQLSELLITLELANLGGYITVDYGTGTAQCDYTDVSAGSFFTSYDPAGIAGATQTASAMYALLDNYVADVTVVDSPDAAQVAEEDAFLDLVLQTPVMNEAYNFLVTNGVFTGDVAAFRAQLHEMWFEPYDRDGTSATVLGSSGFEHVLIGEAKEGDVSGFHGWMHFAEEEAKGILNYFGWLNYQADFGGGRYGVTDVFEWTPDTGGSPGTVEKCIGSMFVGTSPELDLAVYSVCWLARNEAYCPMSYNGIKFQITTYTQDGKYVGSAYPDFVQ